MSSEPQRKLTPGLLGEQVYFAELHGEVVSEELFAVEAQHIARAVAKRRNEFTRVRQCAGAALGQLGLTRPPMVPGPNGEPSWPAGVVGSMTHCPGFGAAAVARSHQLLSLGIDAEPNEPLPGKVLELVAGPTEQRRVRSLSAADPTIAWDRLSFSCKESVYKAWFPLTQAWLGFEEGEVLLHPDGTFQTRLFVTGLTTQGQPVGSFDGRWRVADGFIITGACLAEPGLASQRKTPAATSGSVDQARDSPPRRQGVAPVIRHSNRIRERQLQFSGQSPTNRQHNQENRKVSTQPEQNPPPTK